MSHEGVLSLIWLAGTHPPVLSDDQCVPTDTVTVQVFERGAPCAGGSITPGHSFNGGPQGTTSIPLNSNGIVALKPGSTVYIPTVDAGHSHRVYGNGVKASNQVTSRGNCSNGYVTVYVP
ncbi:MAG TPA: hypothetical protein VMS77_10065 [Conexivisphaerales archaeon]|nr:hypothetical protein [Conexivisphaerales archaeon]